MRDSRHQAGYTLIELIAVIVLISVAVTSLGGLFSNAVSNLSLAEQINRSVRIAQNCAERLIGVRQDRGYTEAVNELCDETPGYGINYSGTTTLTAGSQGCPSKAPACTLRQINVTQAGSSAIQTSIVVLLVP